ncbi:MAG: DUF72 domain-containing protein [Phycisphaerae bacterium]|nr:DUF72 domain-containing protein [Phycisphaerae bacterium]
MSKRREIKLGTSGWSYDDWVGPFYPSGTASSDYLTVYAEHYSIVEVDSTFYRMPTAEMVDRWRTVTPRHFEFTLKVPSVITHEKVLLGCRDEFRAFAEIVKSLGKKLRAVLLQFAYFNKQAFPSSKEFFERLDRFLASVADEEIPIAVEIRNKTWLGKDWFELLRKHHAASVLLDHAWMPSIPEMIERYDVLTGPFVYTRLIGDREGIEKITKKWDRVVVDRSSRLAELAEALRKVAANTEVIVFANNHFAGHAPATLTELASVMGHARSIPHLSD